jgi:hypothetical protein
MFVIDIPSLHVDDDLKQQQPDTGPPIKAVPGTAAQPPTSMCCWWALLKEHHPHCAPTPTSLYNWSMSLWVHIIFFPKSSLMDFLQLYFLFSILNCTRGHSVIDGGWVISLSLSLSLSHTHTQLISSPHMNEWMKPGKVSFIFAVPKVKSINTGI